MQRKGGQVYARERERRKIRGMPSKDAQQGKVIGVDNRSRRKKGMREKGGGRERHWRKMRTPKDRKGKKKGRKSLEKGQEKWKRMTRFLALQLLSLGLCANLASFWGLV